ncbi:MAG: hypothetical protein ACJ8AO_10780 [Gemmatimonadaceae bacterium]
MTSPFASATRATRRLATSIAFAATAAVGAACGGDDGFSPDDEDVIGQYETTQFMLFRQADTLDLLAEGSFVTLALDANRTTSGQFFVFQGNDDGTDFQEDLTGTWQLTGTKVLLDQTADTFLRDYPLHVREAGVLELRETDNAGVTLVIRLERQ